MTYVTIIYYIFVLYQKELSEILYGSLYRFTYLAYQNEGPGGSMS